MLQYKYLNNLVIKGDFTIDRDSTADRASDRRCQECQKKNKPYT